MIQYYLAFSGQKQTQGPLTEAEVIAHLAKLERVDLQKSYFWMSPQKAWTLVTTHSLWMLHLNTSSRNQTPPPFTIGITNEVSENITLSHEKNSSSALPPNLSNTADQFDVIEFSSEVSSSSSAPVNIPSAKPADLEPSASHVAQAEKTSVPSQNAIKESVPSIDPSNLSSEPNQASSKADSFFDKRAHARVQGRLRTILTNKVKAFITHTIDFSEGGMQVENSIPEDLLNGALEVYICGPNGKRSLLFSCQVVTSTQDRRRFQFTKIEDSERQELRIWVREMQSSAS